MRTGLSGLHLRTEIITQLLLLCFFLSAITALPVLGAPGPKQPAVDSAPQSSGVTDVNALVAGLSDEQVRSLLISELQKVSGNQSAQPPDEADGPGALFLEALDTLSSQSDESGRNAQELLAHIPQVLPDLYRVFLTL